MIKNSPICEARIDIVISGWVKWSITVLWPISAILTVEHGYQVRKATER